MKKKQVASFSKMRNYGISDDIFGTHFTLVFGGNEEMFYKLIYKETGVREDCSGTAIGKFTIAINTDRDIHRAFLWIKEFDLGVISHEVSHYTYYSMNRCGISLCEETDEVFAYVYGFAFEKILKKLKVPLSYKPKKKWLNF